MMSDISSYSPVIQAGLHLLAAHPAVASLTSVSTHSEAKAFEVIASICVRLPSSWMMEGKSPNGVMTVEPVTFLFPPDYPVQAPVVHLRQDFDRAHPHIQPGEPSSPIVPCLYEGDINELFRAEGLWAIVDQLVAWLERAAQDELIDPTQGWEPIRRDALEDFVVVDSHQLRGLISRKENHYFFGLSYLKIQRQSAVGNTQPYFLHGQIREQVRLNKFTFQNLFREVSYRSGVTLGYSIAIVVTPGKLPSGKLHIAGQYRPEDVMNLTDLQERAEEYGCANSLKRALSTFEYCAREFDSRQAKYPVAVILCARRPCNLIGQDSNIEIVPYLVEIAAPRLFDNKKQDSVRPIGHRDAITPALLQAFSGRSPRDERDVILAGCGSLGSKIAIHMARSGTAPTAVIDKRYLSPHNAARHGLLPGAEAMQLSWMDAKSHALKAAIAGLGQSTKAFTHDLALVVRNHEMLSKVIPKNTWGIINTTASLAVREALAATSPKDLTTRVIETCLYANGSVGLITIEGPGRNPNSMDLTVEAYEAIRTDNALQQKVFSAQNPMQRHETGQGCGSTTMLISDSRISLFAASITQAITNTQIQGFSIETGQILLGQVDDSGMSLFWKQINVPPVHIIPIDTSTWSVRLSERAHQKIQQECANHPNVETGGILVGRISNVMQAFLVSDILPAPPDSIRTASNFTLGVQGATLELQQYSDSCQSVLYSLGTWHSHLTDTGPSERDFQTAADIAAARPTPSILIIKTPARYKAILANTYAI